MKKFCSICLFLTIVSAALAQQPAVEVPQSVLSAFHSLYASPSKTKWDKEKFGHYQASFVHQDTVMKTVFDANGHWQHTFKKVGLAAMPAKVMEATNKLAPDYKPVDAWFVQTPDNLMYYVEIKKGASVRNFTFDVNLAQMGENYFEDLKQKKQ